MSEIEKLSRRAVVVGAVVASALGSSPATAASASPDVELIALGKQLDAISAALDKAGEHDEAMALLEKMETLSAAIASLRAKTLQGLQVKARATAWALEGDLFDPMKETSEHNRVAASIVRDLLEGNISAV